MQIFFLSLLCTLSVSWINFVLRSTSVPGLLNPWINFAERLGTQNTSYALVGPRGGCASRMGLSSRGVSGCQWTLVGPWFVPVISRSPYLHASSAFASMFHVRVRGRLLMPPFICPPASTEYGDTSQGGGLGNGWDAHLSSAQPIHGVARVIAPGYE